MIVRSVSYAGCEDGVGLLWLSIGRIRLGGVFCGWKVLFNGLLMSYALLCCVFDAAKEYGTPVVHPSSEAGVRGDGSLMNCEGRVEDIVIAG